MNGFQINKHAIIISICYSFSLVVSLLLLCCNDLEKTITKRWKDQVFEISDNLLAINTDTTSADYLVEGNKAKVIVISDSYQCAPCQLRLIEWKKYITKYKDNVEFKFIVPSKNKYELMAYCVEIGFDYPLFVDINNEYCTSELYPNNIRYRCFVLDKDNKVKMVGNPVHLSSKIDDFTKVLNSL